MGIELDTIATVFAALRSETRQKMESELEASLKDTTEEYRKSPTTRELKDQALAIEVFLLISKKVSREYAEISKDMHSGNSNARR